MCALSVTTQAADAHVTRPVDTLVLVTAPKVTVTLPDAWKNAGLQCTVKNTATGGPTTVAAPPGQTIDGAATLPLKAPLGFCACTSDGTAWWVTASG